MCKKVILSMILDRLRRFLYLSISSICALDREVSLLGIEIFMDLHSSVVHVGVPDRKYITVGLLGIYNDDLVNISRGRVSCLVQITYTEKNNKNYYDIFKTKRFYFLLLKNHYPQFIDCSQVNISRSFPTCIGTQASYGRHGLFPSAPLRISKCTPAIANIGAMTFSKMLG